MKYRDKQTQWSEIIWTILSEDFVKGLYDSVDVAIARHLDRLRSEAGIVPNCQSGCCHCCRYLILINIAEARILAQYVKREMSADQINDLQVRTRQWHEWNDSGPGRYLSATVGETRDLSDYTHCCPMLVDGRCSAYPARPMVCRAHFVSSDPLLCRAANDPQSTDPSPVVLMPVAAAVSQFSMVIRDRIEKAGLEFTRSQMLLPHWLAIEMGWHFIVQPTEKKGAFTK